MSNNTTIPAPIAWEPSSFWDGNDGLWNTFVVNVGTPPQQFRVLPSTEGQETWLPDPQGCLTADPSNPGYCGSLRGALPVNNVNSSGFQSNQSSSWNVIGLFTLDAQEADLGYTGNGFYGFDTVALNGTSTPLSQTKEVVASVPDLDYWLGYFGLGPKTINFTTFSDPIPSYMSDLVTSNSIPSLSWGYTAGAYYRGSSGQASLTLGGYDANRFNATDLTIAMNQDNSRPLQVAIQKIMGENTLSGSAINLLPTATYHFVDSTLPHIWLPDDAIQQFVKGFGLTYDNKTDLFLINSTMRSKMLQLNPSVTFVLSNTTTAGVTNTVNVKFPYAAFDLNASYPFYSNSTSYFPIRRAANSTQYTIGRTFLQEAYLIADWERGNFTVAQTTFDNTQSKHLVAITKPSNTSSSSSASITISSSSSKGLSSGAIAGVIIGAVAGVALIALGIWFFLRCSRRQHGTTEPAQSGDYPEDKKQALETGAELPHEGAGIVEAPADGVHQKATELPSPRQGTEMEGDLGKSRARPGMHEMPAGQDNRVLVEAPGHGAQRYQLPGSEAKEDAAVS